MIGASHDGLITRFLGADAARGGPCALLGLPADGFTDLDIVTAREKRMQTIDAHPQSQSAAADEVRLALHAATAQLLNPAVRSHIRHGSASTARAQKLVGLEQDVILTLAMFGGWTRRSLPRLMALAHSRGLTASDVAETLRGLARSRTGGKGSEPLARGGSVATAMPQVGRAPGPGLAVLIGSAAVLLIAATVWVVLSMSDASRGPRSDGGPSSLARLDGNPGAATVPSSADAQDSALIPTQPTIRKIETGAILDTLLDAVATSDADADAASSSAVAATHALSAHWLELAGPVRTRAIDTIVELMYRLGGPTGDARELLSAVGSGSLVLRSRYGSLDGDELTRAVWSVGMLTRLKREHDLSAQSDALIDRWLGASLSGTSPSQMSFTGGVLAALQSVMSGLASQSADRSEAWRAWAEAAKAVTETDRSLRVTLLARGAEMLLVQPITPDERSDMYEAITVTIGAMPWSGNDDAQRWLVRQFDNRDVSAASLSAATRALVADTNAENLDPTMVLSATASELERRGLRDRYLLAWGLEQPGSDIAVLDALAKAAKQLDGDLATATQARDALRTAIGFARLNAAASSQWQGDAAAATFVLDQYRVPAPAVSPGPGAPVNTDNGDARWAERFLIASTNLEERAKLLTELRSSGGRRLGAVDAEVLVEAALRGANRRERELAREIVELYGSSPTIVNALLEEAPRIPPTRDMADLIVGITVTPLPDRNSPEWRTAVRRGLVERLSELLAADSDAAGVDELAALLADAYYERALTHRVSADSGDRVVPQAEKTLRNLRDRWSRAAERTIPAAGFSLSLADVERRRAGRFALASGMIQQFAVEELALAETMAIVIASEQPRKADAVQTILDDLAQRRRDATHIFQQIAATERAMVRLWEIRLGADAL